MGSEQSQASFMLRCELRSCQHHGYLPHLHLSFFTVAMDRTEEVTYVTWHAIAFANAFWASMLLVASSIFGHAAVYVCDQGRQQIIELAHIRTGSMDVEDLLQQLPESISKTIHQTTSPHGTVFQSFMLVAALLMLVSEFPKHEYVQLGLDLQLVGLEACRYLFPVIGIILLVFVPMSHDYILMIERFKQPGYQLTLEDKAVFFANKLQEDMHQAAGTLVFAATPGLEGLAESFPGQVKVGSISSSLISPLPQLFR